MIWMLFVNPEKRKTASSQYLSFDRSKIAAYEFLCTSF